VLLLTDPVDAFWTSLAPGLEGKPFKSLSQGDVDFGLVPLIDKPAESEEKPAAVDDAVIVAAVKATLGERVSDVRASQRLTDSAACLVAGGSGPDRELERLLSRANRGLGARPILEINTRHPLVKAISDAKLAQREADVADLSELLLDEAHILDGEVPADPAAFARRINRLVVKGLAGA
jgi:molecular chaperone HtpG